MTYDVYRDSARTNNVTFWSDGNGDYGALPNSSDAAFTALGSWVTRQHVKMKKAWIVDLHAECGNPCSNTSGSAPSPAAVIG